MATNTTNNYFSKPHVGGDTDIWGATLNANWDKVDSIVTGGTQITRLGIGTTNTTLPLICNAASAADIAASFSGFVGIGTTSPDSALHIDSSDPTALTIQRDSGASSNVSIKYDGASQDYYTGIASTSEDFVIGTNANLNTANLLRVTSAGKVGIGTDSPDQKGHISGAGTQYLRVENTTNGVVTDFGTTSTGSTIINRSAHPMSFFTNSTERMRIDASGNVGIGTIAPSHTLEVYANADNKYAARFAQDHATGWGVLIDTDGTANADPALWVKNASDTILWAAQSGNVGIGTSSPDSILSTAGTDTTAYSSSSVGGQNSLATLKIQNLATSANSFASIDFNTNNNRVVNRIVSSHGSLTTDGFLAFVTEGSGTPAERMRIDSSGNVGIGTASPAARLDVKNNTALGGNNGDWLLLSRIQSHTGNQTDLEIGNLRDSAGSTWQQAGTRIQSKIDATFMGYMQFNGTGNEHGISFGVGASTASHGSIPEAMRIDSAGKLGIGTTSPSSRLHVAGDGKFDGGTSTLVDVKCDNGGTATLRLMGDDQGNGRVYVGQSNTFGGGIEYCGNSDPVLSGGGSDYTALYRRDNGTSHWTARNYYNSNNWQFRNTVTATSFVGAGNALTSLPILDSSAVGTYAALLYYNNNNPANLNFGSVKAGSTLRHANFLDQGYGTTSQVPAGTWRLCGQTGRYHGSQSGGGRDTQGSVWLRVS